MSMISPLTVAEVEPEAKLPDLLQVPGGAILSENTKYH